MKLTEALQCTTKISDRDDLNLKNYLRSINFISNLYRFHYLLKEAISLDDIEYLPSFKDCYISEELGLETITEENELRLIKIRSPLFLVDKNFDKIATMLDPICTMIIPEKDVITFFLK